MVVLLSHSKSMTMEGGSGHQATQPAFLDRSEKLVNAVRRMSRDELMDFMQISEKLADLNRERFRQWSLPFTEENARPAALAFTGDVYDGLEADRMSRRDLAFAQQHLRILSGLYGLLRPLDLIRPYRLEMGRPLKTAKADTLYAFWRKPVTEALNDLPDECVVNLASNEYFKAVDKRLLNKRIINPAFKDEKNGQFKVISFYAKKARGRMARWMVEHRLTDPAALSGFAADGYAFNADLSRPDAPVFTRPASHA